MKITRRNAWTGMCALIRNAWRLPFIKALAASVLEDAATFEMWRKSRIRSLPLADVRLGLGTSFEVLYEATKGATTLLEAYVLLSLVRSHHAHSFFEFGTFQGQTSFMLAKNFPHLSVYTLDLPATGVDRTAIPLSIGERRYVEKPTIGSKFLGTPEQAKITQLSGDSAAFDYSPYLGKMDFVFVDGCHDYEYIRNDTAHALKLLGEKGAILWHDYLTYGSVSRYLNELGRELPLRHIQNTSFVLYVRT
ncbi:MAG: class I SAM-dependent methyltransferase [Candidatus Peregrinibacteria bacterium]